MRPEVLAGIGGFGALCGLPAKYREPVLVSGTDGVGTKLKLAFELDWHDTIGIDLVAMVIDDLVVCGAEPLFMTDYIAVGSVVPERIAAIVSGDSAADPSFARDLADKLGGGVALRNEAVVMFLAGHETTANTMAWAWYLLSQDPASRARLEAEVGIVDVVARQNLRRDNGEGDAGAERTAGAI